MVGEFGYRKFVIKLKNLCRLEKQTELKDGIIKHVQGPNLICV
mgnify:FL=1